MAMKASFFILLFLIPCMVYGQDYVGENAAPPPAMDNCDGIFLSYAFISRVKEFPHVKNASAQAYAFSSMANILNAQTRDLKAWKMFIEFQHDEILVSTGAAVLSDGTDLPAYAGNGTFLSGFPQSDLKNSIDTAGDMTQIQVEIEIKGTQFGVKPPGVPMPKTIRLANEGYKCPAPTRHKTEMHVCCILNKKFKPNATIDTKFLPRPNGDLMLSYDVIQAFEGNYLAQVTIDNNHPLGRLDNWNLTWEWKRGEFIFSMRGAYTLKKDYSDCIYGAAGSYYQDLDFTPVMNCQKRPIIADLPPEREKDEKNGNLPFCCKNGTLLPASMDSTKSKSMFQLQVYKLPPDMNRTALYAPQNWKIKGVLNPDYQCGPPVRVSPTQFPDTSGLLSTSSAVASWGLACNITRPKNKHSSCCVSFSAFYNDSVIPCNTCACGCPETETCNPDASPLLLPSEALLVPFANRTKKAIAWAKIKHYNVPKPLPCADNCGVTINWHIYSDYRKGWTARITLFNWEEYVFHDWFTAIQMGRAYPGYENVYSFNGTRMPELNSTIFMQGLPGNTYLIAQTNGTNPAVDPPVPGKQQSVISFTKKLTPGISIIRGDGFPTRVYYNGEECALPTEFPKGDAYQSRVNLLPLIFLTVMTFILMMDHLC
ncbi:COBRA-like protein 10 [Tasmannia lanceolata]|uniref:COBRA-like protein 10 n=1 Tax=Tasmannia lanceolata TaxID=3420 RepID=UPI004062CAAD